MSDSTGKVVVEVKGPQVGVSLNPSSAEFVLGRGLIVHSAIDDCVSQVISFSRSI
jgi:hypothetical protein